MTLLCRLNTFKTAKNIGVFQYIKKLVLPWLSTVSFVVSGSVLTNIFVGESNGICEFHLSTLLRNVIFQVKWLKSSYQ